jgi:hypothetical protein
MIKLAIDPKLKAPTEALTSTHPNSPISSD